MPWDHLNEPQRRGHLWIRAVCGVANSRDSTSYRCDLRLASHPEPQRPFAARLVRSLFAWVFLPVLLAGCAQTQGWAWPEAPWRASLDVSARHYGFDWRIEGDPALAPLQVFDDGRRVWLQYPLDAPVPAVFQRSVQGDRLLQPRREGDYLVIEGVPDHLVMRGGHRMAQARREAGQESGPASSPSVDALAPTPVDSAVPVIPAAKTTDGAAPIQATQAAQTVSVAPAMRAAVPVPVMTSEPVIPQASAVMTNPVPAPAAVPDLRPAPIPVGARDPMAASASKAMSVSKVAAAAEFHVSPEDGNIRKALGRWARDAGWLFDAEHWAVDVDIPLAGSAAFGDAFRPAVRGLLAATELGERPLQPCFYANRVLRVVPLAQRCDRTLGPKETS